MQHIEHGMEDWSYLFDITANECMQQQLDPNWSRHAKVAFARVGLFGCQTLTDYGNKVQRMQQGVYPGTKDYWYLDKWKNNPLRVSHVRTIANKFANRANWAVALEYSPIYVVPHCWEQYRIRVGSWMPKETLWDMPHTPKTIALNNTVQTNSMLPTERGMFLGYSTQGQLSSSELYKYKRRNLQIHSNTQAVEHFYAITFIASSMLTHQQRDAWHAYYNRDYAKFDEINWNYMHEFPASIFAKE